MRRVNGVTTAEWRSRPHVARVRSCTGGRALPRVIVTLWRWPTTVADVGEFVEPAGDRGRELLTHLAWPPLARGRYRHQRQVVQRIHKQVLVPRWACRWRHPISQ